MFLLYCPPTSNMACVNCPSEQYLVASMRTANMFSFLIVACSLVQVLLRSSLGTLSQQFLRRGARFRHQVAWLTKSTLQVLRTASREVPLVMVDAVPSCSFALVSIRRRSTYPAS